MEIAGIMALDLVALDTSGRIAMSVPIGLDAHERLVRHANAHGSRLLLRLADYYNDAVFQAGELPNLRRELVGARSVLGELVDQMTTLIDAAGTEELSVQAIAD